MSAEYITALTLHAYQTADLAVTLLAFQRKDDESTHLEVGFPLRCFQRLSIPYIATQRLPLAR
jgi:nucleoside 2-deoxyribosyltransferase